MHCAKCGKEIPEGAKFCTACGTPVVESKHPVGTWKRLANMLIDTTASVLFLIVGFGVIAILMALSPVLGIVLAPVIVLLYTGTVYYIFFESIWQRTPGKWATGTKVVKLDGTKPGFWRIVGRSFARVIPFESISFLFGEHPFGWHDQISGTMVVPAEYSVADAAAINPKDKGKSSTGAIVLGILFAILTVIAIIGILSSIVLVSLSAAREKGSDLTTKAAMSQAHVAAEIAALTPDGSSNYTSVCNDKNVRQDLAKASPDSVCNDNIFEWAASAPLKSGGYYCLDSSGSSGRTTATPLTIEASCAGLFPYEGGQ